MKRSDALDAGGPESGNALAKSGDDLLDLRLLGTALRGIRCRVSNLEPLSQVMKC